MQRLRIFSTLVERDEYDIIHTKNLQFRVIEMFKTKDNINPNFMKEIFLEHHVVYNLITNLRHQGQER